MDNLTKQIEEIEALSAIYGEEFQTEDEENRMYSIKIVNNDDAKIYVKLYTKFPTSYPLTSPPTFEISAPYLKQDKKAYLSNVLQDVYLSHIGQNVIFQWIEKIREELQSISPESPELNRVENSMPIVEQDTVVDDHKKTDCISPSITHGEVILDRKSTFQGHAAAIFSTAEVRQVLMKLKENKKIMQATHNMYAYRIYNESTESFTHDCDDDGEDHAGSRLLHLLEIMNVKNVMVVVSRWYGGIHLGPDRFRHINNAARGVLIAADLVSSPK